MSAIKRDARTVNTMGMDFGNENKSREWLIESRVMIDQRAKEKGKLRERDKTGKKANRVHGGCGGEKEKKERLKRKD